MILEHFVIAIVPFVIHALEAMGIFVIIFAAVKAFIQYARRVFNFSDHTIKIELARALALSLEFKLGGEILKTVIIRTLDEMYILAAIIALRAILTFVIHWEINTDSKHCHIAAKPKEKELPREE